MNVQPSFKAGDLVTGLTVEYRHYGGIVCPITILRADKIIPVPTADGDPWFGVHGDDPDYQSPRSSVGHHQLVVCGDQTISGALLERVIT